MIRASASVVEFKLEELKAAGLVNFRVFGIDPGSSWAVSYWMTGGFGPNKGLKGTRALDDFPFPCFTKTSSFFLSVGGCE